MKQIDKTCRNCLHRNVCRFYEPNAPDCICNHYVGLDALKPKWIPVTPETMPKEGEKCLCRLTLEECSDIAFYAETTSISELITVVSSGGMRVNHWMPLPDAPEEIEK